MTLSIKGGCVCQHVRYEIAAEPVRMVNCHCRDCQQMTGSAFAPLLVFLAENARLSGEVRYYPVTSARGSKVERGFCPNCGCPVVTRTDARPDRLFVFAASLDDPVAPSARSELVDEKRGTMGPRRSADSSVRDLPA